MRSQTLRTLKPITTLIYKLKRDIYYTINLTKYKLICREPELNRYSITWKRILSPSRLPIPPSRLMIRIWHNNIFLSWLRPNLFYYTFIHLIKNIWKSYCNIRQYLSIQTNVFFIKLSYERTIFSTLSSNNSWQSFYP